MLLRHVPVTRGEGSYREEGEEYDRMRAASSIASYSKKLVQSARRDREKGKKQNRQKDKGPLPPDTQS